MNKITLDYESPLFEVNEEIKTLRTRLLFCGDDKKVILMTSSLPDEGKSTLSLDLAISLSKIQKKVLLLDLDLRKSVLLSKVEAGAVEKGMTHFLSGQCALSDIIFATNIPRFHVIFAGPSVENSTELLMTERFEKVMNALRSAYDYIIIDSPPLGLIIDATVIAQHCDGAVLVVEEGKVKYRLAQETIRKLKNSDCPILGGILSHASRRTRGKYYGKEYRYYKKYGYEKEEDGEIEDEE